jgi:hypothetical protein
MEDIFWLAASCGRKNFKKWILIEFHFVATAFRRLPSMSNIVLRGDGPRYASRRLLRGSGFMPADLLQITTSTKLLLANEYPASHSSRVSNGFSSFSITIG